MSQRDLPASGGGRAAPLAPWRELCRRLPGSAALTSPRGPSDGNDLGIGLQNDGLGLLTLQAGYERPLGEGWTAFLAAGMLRAEEPHPLSGSPDIGTELLAETRWQMASPLALEVGGSVLLTGDFFKAGLAAPAPGTLFELYSRWQLEF